MKNKTHNLKIKVLLGVLLLAIVFSLINVIKAAAPNPGHTWSELGDVLVTVPQGGTGTTTLTRGLVMASGTAAFTTVTAPVGALVGATDSQTLTNKTIFVASNTITDASAAQGDLLKHNGSAFVRFAMGSANQQLRVNTAGTDLEFFTPSAASVAGNDTEVQFNNGGAFGAKSNLAFVTSTNEFRLGGQIRLTGVSDPATPAANNLLVYAKDISGRMMLKAEGPSGVNYPLQPSFFQNNIVMINPSASTAVGTIGNTVTSAGTLSHPTVTETYGWMTNFASAATAGSTAGTGNNGTLWLRGSTAGANGFFFNARLAFPDANYGSGATGARAFVGLTNQSMAVSVGADDPTGHRAGFSYSTNLGDTNWYFSTKDGTAQTRTSTGLAFTAGKVYDFFVYCNPQCTDIDWRVDNVTDGTTANGTATANLPGNTTLMRAGFQISTLTTTARNVRMQRVYTESDR